MRPNETTPLRGGDAQASTVAQRRRTLAAIAVIAVIAAAATAVAWWASASSSSSPASTATDTSSAAPPSDDLPNPAAAETATADEPTAKKSPFCGIANEEAGFVKLANKKDDHYFYWYYESRSKPNVDPLVIWLTGGPGCSSVMALLTENGPCTVLANETTVLNEYSWNSNANVIWLDQPTNVGFSYGAAEDADADENDVGDNIYWFLRGFLAKHPELEGRELFITGESYAGHYVPAAAHKIWQENLLLETAGSDALSRINLQGIAIGNGLTNTLLQYEHVLDMVDNSYNITLMSDDEYETAKAMIPECAALVSNVTDFRHLDGSADVIAKCSALLQPFSKTHRNPYDIRLPCGNVETTEQCYDMSHVTAFLNSEDVQAYLNVSSEHPKQWVECNATVSMDFRMSGDIFHNYEMYVADLLNDGDIRVLLYVGDADTMCNWYGNKAWATALEWEHMDEFAAAEDHPFLTADGSVDAGVVKAYKDQFTFIRLFNAGHLVPMDQPAIALEMLNKFLNDEAF